MVTATTLHYYFSKEKKNSFLAFHVKANTNHNNISKKLKIIKSYKKLSTTFLIPR